MSDDQNRFEEYLAALRSRVSDRCLELAVEGDAVAPAGFREEAFTEVVLEALEDLGQVSGGEICYLERRLGRATGRVNGWNFEADSGQVDLFTTIYRGLETPGNVTATDLGNAVRRAVYVFMEARNGAHAQMEPASAEFDMMQRLNEIWPDVNRVRVIVIADGLAADPGDPAQMPDGPELQVEVWDLKRLFRAAVSGLPYESVEIDIVKRLGKPLPCLVMPESSADYRSCLAIIPGELLHSLYHEFGARLLELNVRSFLQARGKVNRGIRDTLKQEPARFLAYNNGITATAEGLEIGTGRNNQSGITRITGLQVVNGGQTVASIHRAKERDRIDLSDVYVQAKITIVRPEHIETLVPLISRYANTQNRVNEADFSANHPVHVRLQQLSETVWTPGEQSRWFYERARGQYQVARARDGTTPARLRRFDAATPSRQRFDKVQLAKYINAWDQLPHIVSRGGQKNFVRFMERLGKLHGEGWEPDAGYYRQLIAKAILFKRAEKVARQYGFPGYRANAVAYTLSLLSFRTAGRVNLEQVWNEQDVSRAVGESIYDWMPLVYNEIIASAGDRNVTEWCKKEECWRHIQTVNLAVTPLLERELSEGQPLPNVGDQEGREGLNLSAEDRENIARIMQVSAEEWIHICGWGSNSGELKPWQVGIATTLASYAATGWTRVPSKKQAAQAIAILRSADENGGRQRTDEAA